MTATRRTSRQRGLLYYLGLGLSAGLLGMLLLVGALVVLIPAISGATPMTILTSSMEPTYPPGTLIIVKPVAVDEIAVGDPLTYQLESGKPEVVTHRVISISTVNGELSFVTKGDNNAVADAKPVMPVQVRGTVWYAVPYVGFANSLISGENRVWIVPIAALALFAYAGFMLVSGIHTSVLRNRRARERALVSSNRTSLT